MSKQEEENIPLNDEGLENLFHSLIKDLKEDLEEATVNIDIYKEQVLNSPTGKEQYGTYLNDALKIKGSVRERQLKLVNMFKDRVKSKEIVQQMKGQDDSMSGVAPEKVMEMLDNIEKGRLGGESSNDDDDDGE